MRKTKLYNWESKFDFGKYNQKSIKEVFEKNPSYIDWCFQKVDWFCVSDEIFEKIPIVVSLKKYKEVFITKEQQDCLKILNEKHEMKKQKLIETTPVNGSLKYINYFHCENEPHIFGDPRYDRSENPWIDVFGEGEEAEVAYWNTY
jgi:hypothetical protein